ncbi:MAG: hypothetical protein ACLQVJ_13795 [Syntrophobacteraceae bacterium]
MTILEIATLLKDVFLGIAAATTAIVAVVGLKNWSRELKGKAEFEVARGLVRATYKLRNEIAIFRSPLVRWQEFPETYHGFAEKPPDEHAKAWAHVYQKRWDPVMKCLQDFETSSLEAEALWGMQVRSQTNELRQCVVQLRSSIEAVVDDKSSEGEDFRSDPNFGKQMRAIVSGSGSGMDEFSQKIEKAIAGIEEVVRPHLKRN